MIDLGLIDDGDETFRTITPADLVRHDTTLVRPLRSANMIEGGLWTRAMPTVEGVGTLTHKRKSEFFVPDMHWCH